MAGKKELVTQDPFILEEYLHPQMEDKFWLERAKIVSDPQSCFDYDRYGLLVRKSKLDGALQKFIPEEARYRLVHLAFCIEFAFHPSKNQMYYTPRRYYHWLGMASDVL